MSNSSATKRKGCLSEETQRKKRAKKWELDIKRELYEKQNHRCSICRKEKAFHELKIDHEHLLEHLLKDVIESGEMEKDNRIDDVTEHYDVTVRGLLCNDCNFRRLGSLNDDPLLALRLAEYLLSPSASFNLLNDPSEVENFSPLIRSSVRKALRRRASQFEDFLKKMKCLLSDLEKAHKKLREDFNLQEPKSQCSECEADLLDDEEKKCKCGNAFCKKCQRSWCKSCGEVICENCLAECPVCKVCKETVCDEDQCERDHECEEDV